MDRRLGGALLVVMVLALAIIVPARDGRRAAGEATMIPLPADPQIGDCMQEPAAEPTGQSGPGAAPTGSATTNPTIGRATDNGSSDPVGPQFSACDGRQVAGEVVAILSASGDQRARRHRIEEVGLDCRAAGLQYAGLVRSGDHFVLPHSPPNDPVSWRLSISFHSTWILPSPLLQGQGRTWAACVIEPGRGARYQGRIADAYGGGTLPSEFGTCWNAQVVSAGIEPTDCRGPHAAELISAGFVPDSSAVGLAQVKSSCEDLAARVLGRSDPTAGGSLVIKTSPANAATYGQSTSVSVLCYITTADHPLAATVIGLRDRPIPYAN